MTAPIPRWLRAPLAGAALIAAVTGVIALLEPRVPALGLGVLYLLAIVPIALAYGAADAGVVALASMAVFNYFFLPPRNAVDPGSAQDWSVLSAFLLSSLVVSQLAARSQREARRSACLADEQAALRRAATLVAREQAALRRVATLVACGVPSHELFRAVAAEAGALLGADLAALARYEPDRTQTILATWPADGEHPPPGTRVAIEEGDLAMTVSSTCGPARMDGQDGISAGAAALRKKLGIRSSVASPIVVEGRVWGGLVVSSQQAEPLPADTESRLMHFTELLATAMSNAQARADAQRLADEQDALRRVATLVAREPSPEEVFAAVGREVLRVFGVEAVRLYRYEADGTATVVADAGDEATRFGVGTRVTVDGRNVSALVYRTGRSARLDHHDDATGPLGIRARQLGIRSAVGTPIVVGDRLWGVVIVASRRPAPLPASTESRMAEFTALVATAIVNVEARRELAASRARIVAATDAERRRVVRDLHDGAQQRLVHTIVMLKLASRALQTEDEGAPALVAEALEHAEAANVEVRDLAHGILPTVLTRGGLRAGVLALASRMAVPVDIGVAVGPLPDTVEATAYFVVAEALTNVTKHARAAHAAVTARIEDGTLAVHVRDDGIGGARPDGSGLVGLADRLAVLGGRLRIASPPEGGTLVAAAIPLDGR
jgi:signal transduction histidine kinase